MNAISISKNNENSITNMIKFMNDKIKYIQTIIQNTILSINNHKKNNLFSENDINLSVSLLIDEYTKTKTLYDKLQENITNVKCIDNMLNELQKVIDKLSLIICGFGTQHIEDLLFVSFGTEFKNLSFDSEILCDKYKLITTYIRPIGYKTIAWKNKNTKTNNNTFCSNKKTDEIIELDELNQIECMEDINDTDIPLCQRLNYIKCVIRNNKLKKSLIINGIIEDIPLQCLSNLYIKYRSEDFTLMINNSNDDNKIILTKIVESLSLKDFLVQGNNDIQKKIISVIKDVEYIQKNHIDIVVKKFLDFEPLLQRDYIINLLLYKEDSEVDYTCYILYDLINTLANTGEPNVYRTILYENLPWNLKKIFKNIIKLNIKNTQEIMQKYETNKITLEQQIHLLKVNDATKEKAMNKLKEIKGKPDEMTMKTKQFLEGLVKIPFETYYEEPIIKSVKDNNVMFVNLVKTHQVLFDNTFIDIKKKYTNVEIQNYLHKFKNYSCMKIKKIIIENLPKYTQKTLLNIVININNDNKKRNESLIYINNKTKPNLCSKIIEYCNNNSNYEILISLYNDLYVEKVSNPISIKKEIENIKQNIVNISSGIDKMTQILDESIHGHSHAKNQIMKIIGQWMNGEKTGYSFGFEGSPGIGKTSLSSKGLTQCLKNESNESRPFSFIALGGSTNGSYLEGHSYTYMNSTWGKIVDILMESKCMNPIIYIDELDKVSKTEQGKEIIGILTHIIDPTQNDKFQDKYFTGINIDLSKVLFVFSYNDPDQIDSILLDRIHRIKFENLTIEEKIVIVNKYILPEINKKMGFENIVNISDDSIEYIIKSYTLEPGVRKLKELLFDLYGEINLQMLKMNEDNNINIPITITISNLENKYLTKYRKIKEKHIYKTPNIGIINGLWANTLGCGGIIPIQTMFYPSSVFLDLKLTGLQGDVMKESMNVAKSLAWNLTDDKIKQDWLKYFDKTKCQGLHIHCPEGSISKDGPSAGVAITTAIYSLLNKKMIKNDIAITGEITLNGNITAIGGLDIKISSGIRAGIKTFLFPKENDREFQLWQEDNKNIDNIEFVQISNISEIFEHVFI